MNGSNGMARLAALAALMSLALAGCASSPMPRYFRLEALAEPVAAAAVNTPAVIVGPFQLAEYLDRPQIVSREGTTGLRVADYERWAEPLDASFQSVVAANLRRLTGSDRILEFPAQTILAAGRRVTGRVTRLDVDEAGRAVLEVQWGLLDGSGAMVRPGQVSRYEAAAAGQDPGARVAAMNATVGAFSTDLALALKP